MILLTFYLSKSTGMAPPRFAPGANAFNYFYHEVKDQIPPFEQRHMAVVAGKKFEDLDPRQKQPYFEIAHQTHRYPKRHGGKRRPGPFLIIYRDLRRRGIEKPTRKLATQIRDFLFLKFPEEWEAWKVSPPETHDRCLDAYFQQFPLS